jgi:uncharacterized protein YbjT (DUF2867 family)
MKNVLIVGASGMIGGIILKKCLDSDDVGKVTSIVRKTSGLGHPKYSEITHSDFSDFSFVLDSFKEIDAAYFCVGVYTGQVSDQNFKKITVDFAVAFANALKKGSPEATLCFLSGAGADRKETSSMSFARYKGMAENYLVGKAFGGLHIFRPGYIYPVKAREEPNFFYKMYRWLYPILSKIAPATSITSERLADSMFRAGLHGTFQEILENEDIKKV